MLTGIKAYSISFCVSAPDTPSKIEKCRIPPLEIKNEILGAKTRCAVGERGGSRFLKRDEKSPPYHASGSVRYFLGLRFRLAFVYRGLGTQSQPNAECVVRLTVGAHPLLDLETAFP